MQVAWAGPSHNAHDRLPQATFISHALAGGRTLAEVRAAAGHSNVAITSGYLHVVVDEEEGVGELFAILL
jgi:hypothetical protein